MASKPERTLKIVADNRKARFNYAIGDTFELAPWVAEAAHAKRPFGSVTDLATGREKPAYVEAAPDEWRLSLTDCPPRTGRSPSAGKDRARSGP